jgi:hypothetical protein
MPSAALLAGEIAVLDDKRAAQVTADLPSTAKTPQQRLLVSSD